MTLWKIHCMEEKFPGLWHRLYNHQCVAIGWRLGDKTKEHGWLRVRRALERVAVGDYVVAALAHNRIGRIGQVTELKGVWDWNPLVPRSKDLPFGQMGRRIHVRWDLTCGPTDRDVIVSLPEDARLAASELRPTIAEIKSRTLDELQDAMNNRANWIGLLAHFGYERALADYIAAYPHHLEDGLVPHPDSKVREKVFDDRKRLDVLLLDQKDRPVVVECKQGAPTTENLTQLRHYMGRLREETKCNQVRGILVHGGSRNLHDEVFKAAKVAPKVEIVQYHLRVDFAR